MAKNKDIDQIVEQFKAKVEYARQSENYPLEVQKAVQELVQAIGASIPKPAQSQKDPEKGVQIAMEYLKNYTGPDGKLPKGLSLALENIASRKK